MKLSASLKQSVFQKLETFPMPNYYGLKTANLFKKKYSFLSQFIMKIMRFLWNYFRL